jgi:peptide deformylase
MLSILSVPDPVLRQKSALVAFPLSVADKTLVLSLLDAVRADKGSAGLAAPQTGNLRQIIVVTDKDRKPRLMINPILTFVSPKCTVMQEGCLSIPHKLYTVERPFAVKVMYQNIKGRQTIESLQGWEARVVQHEIDHLHGILIDQIGTEYAQKTSQ